MLALVIASLGASVALIALPVVEHDRVVVRGLAVVAAIAFGGFVLLALRLLMTPRILLTDDGISVFAALVGRSIFVPIEVVEVFFMGQGAISGTEPGHPKGYQGAVAANVIVRLAEADTSWHSRNINQWFGLWSDGYITIRGLWCEDINQDLLKYMNHELVAAKRRRREAKPE